MIGKVRDFNILREREKSLDSDRDRWLNRCRAEYHLRPRYERSHPVFRTINTEYASAKKYLPERNNPEDEALFFDAKKRASTVARFSMQAFDLKKEPEFKTSGRRLFELQQELENRK